MLAYDSSGRRGDTLLADAVAWHEFDCEGGGFERGPTLDDLEEMRMEHLRHLLWVKDAMEEVGGDPSMLGESANVMATALQGLSKVLLDPSTSLLSCLQVMLVGELGVAESWSALVETMGVSDEDALGDRFERAAEQQSTHVNKLRMWIAAGQGRHESYRRLAMH